MRKGIYMKYMISETTQEERRKIVDDAIALSSLDSAQPTDFTKNLYEKYIKGELELSEIKNNVQSRYKYTTYTPWLSNHEVFFAPPKAVVADCQNDMKTFFL